MRVTFIKSDRRHYDVAIEREHGPRLVPRGAPGYDDHMPHDLSHYLVEEVFGLQLGVFGQLAAGGEGIFVPAAQDRSVRTRKAAHRLAVAGRADMGRSERLVYLCVSEWQRRAGRIAALPFGVDPDAVTVAELDRAVARLELESRRWRALPAGGSLVFEWPRRLTFNAAGSRLGRSENLAHVARR
jgi:hypothetical protein